MNDSVSLIVTIVGALFTWTCTVVSLTMWLASRFRHLEVLIYRENKKLDDKYMALFKEHGDRITVLELQVTGTSGVTGPNHPRITKQDRY